jgi:hypothetical protein
VLLQTWVSGARKYWIVHEAATRKPPQSFSSSSYLEAIHERERAYVAASGQAVMQETGSKELELTSWWMERTQCAHVYDGARQDLLVRITQVERKSWSRNGDFVIGEHQGVQLVSHAADELKIRRLMASLDRALDRCEETMRCKGHPILCWVNKVLVIDSIRDHLHFWAEQQLVKDTDGSLRDFYHFSFEHITWPQLFTSLC